LKAVTTIGTADATHPARTRQRGFEVASIRITPDLYRHVSDRLQLEAVNAVDSALADASNA
jgi:hypothetical protein